jgi:hypothetical protein
MIPVLSTNAATESEPGVSAGTYTLVYVHFSILRHVSSSILELTSAAQFRQQHSAPEAGTGFVIYTQPYCNDCRIACIVPLSPDNVIFICQFESIQTATAAGHGASTAHPDVTMSRDLPRGIAERMELRLPGIW